MTMQKTNIQKEHYVGLDFLRVIACIGIVLMHIISPDNNAYDLSGYFFEKVIPSFTDFVFLFMLISSFGLCVGYYDDVMSCKFNALNFYKKRYYKILPFFSLLVAIDVILNFDSNSLAEAIADISLLFGLFPNEIKVIGVGWFLGLVFAFYMIFPFFVTLISNKRKAWISFIITVLFNILLGAFWNVERHNIVYSLCFFVLGGLIYVYRRDIQNCPIWILFLFFVMAVFVYYFIGANTLTRLIVSASLLMLGVNELCKKIHNRFIVFLSNISMEIYLCHMAVFRLIEKMKLNYFFGQSVFSYLFTSFVVIIGAVIFSVIIRKLIFYIENRIKELIRNESFNN